MAAILRSAHGRALNVWWARQGPTGRSSARARKRLLGRVLSEEPPLQERRPIVSSAWIKDIVSFEADRRDRGLYAPVRPRRGLIGRVITVYHCALSLPQRDQSMRRVNSNLAVKD